MKAGFKFILAFAVAALCMLAFRSLAFTLLTVDGNALEPVLRRGDRVVVNRWSYGLRAGGNGSLFSYGRLWRSEVRRGDIVAFDSPSDSISGIVVGRGDLWHYYCPSVVSDVAGSSSCLYVVPGGLLLDGVAQQSEHRRQPCLRVCAREPDNRPCMPHPVQSRRQIAAIRGLRPRQTILKGKKVKWWKGKNMRSGT